MFPEVPMPGSKTDIEDMVREAARVVWLGAGWFPQLQVTRAPRVDAWAVDVVALTSGGTPVGASFQVSNLEVQYGQGAQIVRELLLSSLRSLERALVQFALKGMKGAERFVEGENLRLGENRLIGVLGEWKAELPEGSKLPVPERAPLPVIPPMPSEVD